MNRTKLIAICGLCTAVVTGCLWLSSVVHWLLLMLGVVAALATVIPLLCDPKNLVQTLLVYFAGSILGLFLGGAGIVYAVPIVAFCIPFAIVKVHGEGFRLTATIHKENILDDPFEENAKVLKVQVKPKTNLPKAVRWILYYVLLEIGIGLTVLSAYIFMRPLFETMTQSTWFWIVVGAMQLAVFPYDLLLRGCLVAAAKVVRRAKR